MKGQWYEAYLGNQISAESISMTLYHQLLAMDETFDDVYYGCRCGSRQAKIFSRAAFSEQVSSDER